MEKLLAARRLGIFDLVLPKQNEKNVNEALSQDLRREINVHYVSMIDEVLELVLTPVSNSSPRTDPQNDRAPIHETVQ